MRGPYCLMFMVCGLWFMVYALRFRIECFVCVVYGFKIVWYCLVAD
jgi:hypothetical protein